MMMNGWLIDDLIFSKIASSVRMCFHHSYGIGFMSKRHMPDMRRLNFFYKYRNMSPVTFKFQMN